MKVRMMIEHVTKMLNKADGSNLRIGDTWTADDKPFADLVDNDPENTLALQGRAELGFRQLSFNDGAVAQYSVHFNGTDFVSEEIVKDRSARGKLLLKNEKSLIAAKGELFKAGTSKGELQYLPDTYENSYLEFLRKYHLD